jgi:hypothetical protein
MSNQTKSQLTIKEAVMEGCFIGTTFPVRAFASITTQASQIEFDDLFDRWVRRLEAHARVSLAWIKVYKNEPTGHAHIAFIAKAPLYCSPAAAHWRRIAGRFPGTVRLEPYRDRPCSLDYVCKRLEASVRNEEFSNNLAEFAIE